MAERNLIRRIIALFDVESHKKAEDETGKSLGRAGKKGGKALTDELGKSGGTVDKIFARIKAAAISLGTAMVAAFTFRKIVEFGKAAVRAAAESEIAWRNLAGSVNAAGIEFAKVEPQLRAAADQFERITTHDDDAFAETLQRLIALTGDYAASVQNVGLVADVAARFFDGDLAPAADLVGRAMTGNLRALKQLGISAKDAQTALNQLAERSFGAAAERAGTFGGKLEQINNAWENFQEAVGDAIATAGGGIGVLDVMLAVIRSLTRFVTENATSFGHLGSILRWLAEKVLARTISLAIIPLATSLTLVATAAGLAARGAAFIGRMFGANTAALDEFRVKADELRNSLARLTIEAGKTLLMGLQIPGAPTPPKTPGAPPRTAPAVVPATPTSIPEPAGLEEVVAKHKAAAEEVQTVWAQAMGVIAQESEANMTLLGMLSDAWVSGGFKGIIAFAKQKVKENIASAIEMGARALGALGLGNVPAASAFGKSALQHLVAAAAWKGIGSVGGGGGGGQGGAGLTSGTAAGVDRAGSAQAPGQEIHIYLDPLSPQEPRFQSIVSETNRQVAERFGSNASVTWHPRTGSNGNGSR